MKCIKNAFEWKATRPTICSLETARERKQRHVKTWVLRKKKPLVKLQSANEQQNRCTVWWWARVITAQHACTGDWKHIRWLLTYFQMWPSSFLWGARGKRQKGESSLTISKCKQNHRQNEPASQSRFNFRQKVSSSLLLTGSLRRFHKK